MVRHRARLFPATPIRIYGPPLTSGPRDEDLPAADSDAVVRDVCGRVWKNGAYIDAGKNDRLFARRLLDDPQAAGIIGYGVLKRHVHLSRGPCRSRASHPPPTTPSKTAAIPSRGRSCTYVKVDAHRPYPGLTEFVSRFLADSMIGPDGRLFRSGLIPMGDKSASSSTPRCANSKPAPDAAAVLAGTTGQVLDRNGGDHAAAFRPGARLALAAAEAAGWAFALLTDRSPSCGSRAVPRRALRRRGAARHRAGVTAALLTRHGVRVFSRKSRSRPSQPPSTHKKTPAAVGVGGVRRPGDSNYPT